MSNFGTEGYVVDTSAWIEFFRDSKQGADTKEIIYYKSEETITPSIVLAEFKPVSYTHLTLPTTPYV